MRWTAHMQDCLDEIEARHEDPLDRNLVQYVKTQLIAEKAMSLESYDANIQPDSRLHPPPYLFAQELLGQLSQVRSTTIDASSQNGKYHCYVAHATQ